MKVETAQKIRQEVFVKEQGIPEELEIDGDDDISIHMLALASNQQIIGTGRLTIHADFGILSRISVIETYRNKGIGKHILSVLEIIARQNNLLSLTLSPHSHLEEFYTSLGYQKDGEGKVVGKYSLLSMTKQL